MYGGREKINAYTLPHLGHISLAKLTPPHIHGLCSDMLGRGLFPRGVPLTQRTPREALGHAGVVITLDTYSHVLPGRQEEAALNFEQALRDAKIERQTSSEKRVLGRPVRSLLLPFLPFVPQWAAFVWRGVLNQSVYLPPFVSLRQVLGYWQAFLVHEQQAVAIFVNLHVVAGTNPCPVRDFFFFVWIEATGAQRPPQIIDVPG